MGRDLKLLRRIVIKALPPWSYLQATVWGGKFGDTDLRNTFENIQDHIAFDLDAKVVKFELHMKMPGQRVPYRSFLQILEDDPRTIYMSCLETDDIAGAPTYSMRLLPT